METEKILLLDPSEILIRENARFALKPYRIERLAEMILADSGVNTPAEVQKLSTPEDGKSYVLTVGHYRHAAVSKLNEEQKAGLKLPVRVMPVESEAARVLRQISENNERENMSPMDKAIAMERLVSAGVSKMDIRKAFAQPGGRKGLKVQPASNSYVNLTRSYLGFPKDIQKKLHDGIIGTGTASELLRYPSEKWQAILDRAEADRIKGIDAADKEEEKFLKSEKELTEKTQEADKIAAEQAKLKADAEAAEALIKDKEAAVTAALQAKIAKGLSKEDKAKANEHFKAAEAALKSANDVAEKATKELAKVEDKAKTAKEKADAIKARLEAARNAKSAAKPIGKADIKKAAKKEGAVAKGAKAIPLNASEMKEVIKSVILLSDVNKEPKTRAIGELILACFDGTIQANGAAISDAQVQLGIARIVGEKAAATPIPAKKK